MLLENPILHVSQQKLSAYCRGSNQNPPDGIGKQHFPNLSSRGYVSSQDSMLE